jgi:hypothetical protein
VRSAAGGPNTKTTRTTLHIGEYNRKRTMKVNK